jgi:hypothetical protein
VRRARDDRPRRAQGEGGAAARRAGGAAIGRAGRTRQRLNARWSHASLGLRYLYANLGELQSRARIEEFTIATPLDQVLERLLEDNPRIIGLGVYIWNVERTTELIARLREAAPTIRIVIGGPEVSHEVQGQAIVQMADHVITGPADLSFAVLARQLVPRLWSGFDRGAMRTRLGPRPSAASGQGKASS